MDVFSETDSASGTGSHSSRSSLKSKSKINDISIFGSKRGLRFALTSGVLASFAGLLGKFSMSSSDSVWLCERISASLLDTNDLAAFTSCNKVSIYLQIILFLSMIFVNAWMWTTFVKALRYCNSSLEATVTNTAANFLISALVGQIVFGETLTLLWWIGTLLILFGLALMNQGEKIRVSGSHSMTRKKRR